MTVEMEKNGTCLNVTVEGRLDTLTSPELEQKLEGQTDGCDRIVFELGKLEYISSSGLRVFVGLMQDMEDDGELVLRNLTDAVKDVFEVTGLSDSFTIE